MAKIAVALERALERRAVDGGSGMAVPRIVARGDGWTVGDVVCTSGPGDRPFEEQHTRFAIAVVIAGTFQYRSSGGGGLMTPGSLMLGSPGQCYQCGHEHGHGDRCVAFWYEPAYFERIASPIRRSRGTTGLPASRLPAMRALSPLVAAAAMGVAGVADIAWEELGVRLAAAATAAAPGSGGGESVPVNAAERVTRIARLIERHPAAPLTLDRMSRDARLSPYHFLRTFEGLIGVTPHQYVLRARLRAAALRLADEPASVIDIAFGCGFGDVSNFNRAFRAEFGVSPRAYRAGGVRRY